VSVLFAGNLILCTHLHYCYLAPVASLRSGFLSLIIIVSSVIIFFRQSFSANFSGSSLFGVKLKKGWRYFAPGFSHIKRIGMRLKRYSVIRRLKATASDRTTLPLCTVVLNPFALLKNLQIKFSSKLVMNLYHYPRF